MVEELACDGRIIDGRGNAIDEPVVDWAATQVANGHRGVVLASYPERVASLSDRLRQARLPAIATQYLPPAVTEPVLAQVRRPARRGPLLADQLTRASDLAILVDRDTTTTDADLVAPLRLDMPLTAAVTEGPAAWQLPSGAVLRPADLALPRFAVDWTGTPTTDHKAIRDIVAFWVSAPLDLEWAGGFRLTDVEVLAALTPESTAPAGRPVPVDASAAVVDEPVAGSVLEIPGDEAFEPSDDLSPDDLSEPGDADCEDDFGSDGPPDDDWEERDWDADWPETTLRAPRIAMTGTRAVPHGGAL